VPEPVTEAPEAEKVRPWNRRPNREPEPETEVVAAAEPAEVPAVPETPGAAGGDGPSAGTVVIIEDDPSAAIYYATLFRGNGYHVEVANDGVSGVDLCTRMQPQLIMLDVMMPRQNGILVLQTLRASDETKNTPVVVMSNFSEPTLIKRALQLGALEYVIKTQVEGPALLNALPRWMNREKAFAAA
jgi:CheY-like chemotaxis protein